MFNTIDRVTFHGGDLYAAFLTRDPAVTYASNEHAALRIELKQLDAVADRIDDAELRAVARLVEQTAFDAAHGAFCTGLDAGAALGPLVEAPATN